MYLSCTPAQLVVHYSTDISSLIHFSPHVPLFGCSNMTQQTFSRSIQYGYKKLNFMRISNSLKWFLKNAPKKL
jgi:hypothetical protein